MSLVDGGNMYMPVAPAATSYGAGGGSMWGDSLFWIIVLFLFGFMGGGFGGGYGAGNGMVPFMMNNTNNDVQRGFDQQAIMNGIGGVNAGINSLAQGQCAGFAGVNAGVATGFAQAEIAANGRQMASMQQNWNAQTAIDGRLDTLAMNQQAGLCENRAAIADVKYAIAQDGAQTRANTDAKVQAVMDELHQMQVDNLKQNYENRIAGMQNQIDALQYQVNNADRNVALANEVDALYNRLNSCPVSTVPVYGRTPIFNPGNGCGCGGNNGTFLQTA